ncbi:MAG: hypothetical protein NVV82_04440 [Sporocytophaga sp.]|nr:hypothetical protein [Sporocytophaga sp.]
MKQIIFNKIIFSISFIFLLFLLIGNLNAQDNIPFKKNEVWINFFNSGANYKRSLNPKTFLKVGVTLDFSKGLSIHNNYNNNLNSNKIYGYFKNIQYNSISLGIEKRVIISSKMTLYHGPELLYGYSNNKRKGSARNMYNETNHKNQKFGAGYTIGAIYNFNSFLGIGINWFPYIYYNFSKTESIFINPNTQVNQTYISQANTFGVQLATPDVNLILKF